MTPGEQYEFDLKVAGFLQQRQGMSDLALVSEALAELMLFCGGGSKYGLSPSSAATYLELMRRAQPSTAA
jgi:hypothetical protein